MVDLSNEHGHENIATTVDLYGTRIAAVDSALADAVGALIFAPDNVEPLRVGGP